MKKFLENRAYGLAIAFCAAVLIIIGLSGWIYLDFRGDENRDLMVQAESEAAAQRLLDALESGDAIMSYHYARMVKDSAARSGGAETAQRFAGLAETIRITGVTEDMVRTAQEYLEGKSGEAEPVSDAAVLPGATSELEDVAVLRRNDALAVAEEIMGAKNFLTTAVRCRAGEFLFTCRNAYAVIDEKTSLPVEIGISLPPSDGNTVLSPEECRERADGFLRKYFPAVGVQAVRVIPGDDCVNVEYRIDGRTVRASVRRDTGRIVRYTAR